MLRILRYIWAVYFLIVFALVFLILYPFWVFMLRNPKNYRRVHRMRQFWGKFIMIASFVFPKTKHESKLDPQGTYIFMANHFSYMDILSMIAQTGCYFRFLAKKELADIPLFGILFRTIDIPVDRKNMKKAHLAFVEADKSLDRGESLCIFPEGGIGKKVPEMSRFKKGGFVLAINHGVPIVPITIVDNWRRLPGGGLEDGGSPGQARMIIHEPIITEGMTEDDLNNLQNQVFDTIQNQFNEITLQSNNQK